MPQSASTLPPKPDVYCSYCGQGFTWEEHLERHILTHTNVRPFRCPDCKFTFKRKDLLQRHYKTIHSPPCEDGNSMSEQTSASLINRTPIACVNCALCKTKCDTEESCRRCRKRGLTCERREFRRTRGKGDIKADDPSRILDESPENVSVENEQEEETQVISGINSDTHQQAWSLYATPNSAQIDSNGDTSTVTASATTSLATQSITLHVPLDPILYQGADMQGAQSRSTGFPMSFPKEKMSASPHDTPTGLFETVNLDTSLCDNYFDSALMDMHFTSDSLENEPSYLDWEPVQQEPPDMYTQLPNTGALHPRQTWPIFRCNPGELEHVTTSREENIAKLRTLNDPKAWCSHASSSCVESDFALQQIDPFVRDRMLGITQHVWQLSKNRIFSSRTIYQQIAEESWWMDTITLLPQKDALAALTTKYMRQDDEKLHLFPQQKPFPSEHYLSQSEDIIMAGILILLKLAQAMRSASLPQARGVCSGFTEVCSSLVDDAVYTKEDATQAMTAESIEVSLGLLQLLLWSGDPWHMSIALDVRERHAKIVKKAILVENARHSSLQEEVLQSGEGLKCMLHSWVSLDLEVSLFHDISPELDATSITFPLPLEAIAAHDTPMTMNNWEKKIASPSIGERVYSSLAELFEAFKAGQLSLLQDISATHLRLLLHPLQALSMRLHQCLDTFGNLQTAGTRPNTTLSLASKAFIDEQMILLARWHHLTKIVAARSELDVSKTLASSLVLYHIMVLNSLASFPEVERLTRLWPGSRTPTPTHSYHSWLRTASPESLALLMFHCGQCLDVLRRITPMDRPLWWPAALYRVTLVLCQAIISHNSMSTCAMFGFGASADFTTPDSCNLVYLDRDFGYDTDNRDLVLMDFLGKLHVRPVLTGADGNAVMLVSEMSVLDHCIAMLEQHMFYDESEFACGVCNELSKLRLRWKMVRQ